MGRRRPWVAQARAAATYVACPRALVSMQPPPCLVVPPGQPTRNEDESKPSTESASGTFESEDSRTCWPVTVFVRMSRLVIVRLRMSPLRMSLLRRRF